MRATQRICPSCLYPHEAENVEPISAGEKGCEFCPRPAGQLTETEYRQALADARRIAAAVEVEPDLDKGVVIVRKYPTVPGDPGE
jgi:hypothetical protein